MVCTGKRMTSSLGSVLRPVIPACHHLALQRLRPPPLLADRMDLYLLSRMCTGMATKIMNVVAVHAMVIGIEREATGTGIGIGIAGTETGTEDMVVDTMAGIATEVVIVTEAEEVIEEGMEAAVGMAVGVVEDGVADDTSLSEHRLLPNPSVSDDMPYIMKYTCCVLHKPPTRVPNVIQYQNKCLHERNYRLIQAMHRRYRYT